MKKKGIKGKVFKSTQPKLQNKLKFKFRKKSKKPPKFGYVAPCSTQQKKTNK
jgi:hypothetical protein